MTPFSNALKTALLALFSLVCCAVPGHTQELEAGARDNVLFNANQFGYARIVKELGELSVGEGRSWPVDLVFSSDPSVRPGIFGPGWRLPLFDSTAYRSRRGVLVWEAPDEYRRFFVEDDTADTRRGQAGYISQKQDWRAVEDERRGVIRIESLKTPDRFFEYRDGQLHEFSFGDSSSVFATEYGGRGNLRRVFDRSDRRDVLEVRYSSSEVKEVVVGESATTVEMGEGDWTAPDGKADYQDYRVGFMVSLGEDRYDYEKAERVTRSKTKSQRLAVNRLTSEELGRESWLTFEAQSGFVVADSGGVYTVENDAYNPFIESTKGQSRVSPQLVEIKRQPNSGGKQQLWSRDWPKGVELFSDPDGSLNRRTWIMAKGAAYGKLRKVEKKLKDHAWERIRSNSYDENGSLVRIIDRDQVMMMLRTEQLRNGDLVKERFIRDQLISRKTYKKVSEGDAVQLIEVVEWDGDQTETSRYNDSGSLRDVVIEGRKGVARKTYDKFGRPLGLTINGEVMKSYEYLADGSYMITDNIKGKKFHYEQVGENETKLRVLLKNGDVIEYFANGSVSDRLSLNGIDKFVK